MHFKGEYAALAAVLLAISPAGADVMPLKDAANLFGARPGAAEADLSPLGDKLVYLAADGGARTVIKVLDLNTDKERRIIASDGTPESLKSCEFASETWLVCRYGGNAVVNNLVLGFSRLVAINLDKNELKPLGVQQDFDRDEGIRQEDGQILDWLTDGATPAVLMARNHVAQHSELGSNIGSDSQGGLAVEKIDLASMHVSVIEPPRVYASMFMTDGKSKVRLVGTDGVTRGGEQLSGKRTFRFRLANGKSGATLASITRAMTAAFGRSRSINRRTRFTIWKSATGVMPCSI